MGERSWSSDHSVTSNDILITQWGASNIEWVMVHAATERSLSSELSQQQGMVDDFPCTILCSSCLWNVRKTVDVPRKSACLSRRCVLPGEIGCCRKLPCQAESAHGKSDLEALSSEGRFVKPRFPQLAVPGGAWTCNHYTDMLAPWLYIASCLKIYRHIVCTQALCFRALSNPRLWYRRNLAPGTLSV